MTKTKRAFLKALSSVTGNLSAAWFAVVLITPNFANIFSIEVVGFLTQNIILSIVFLAITTIIERKLSK